MAEYTTKAQVNTNGEFVTTLVGDLNRDGDPRAADLEVLEQVKRGFGARVILEETATGEVQELYRVFGHWEMPVAVTGVVVLQQPNGRGTMYRIGRLEGDESVQIGRFEVTVTVGTRFGSDEVIADIGTTSYGAINGAEAQHLSDLYRVAAAIAAEAEGR